MGFLESRGPARSAGGRGSYRLGGFAEPSGLDSPPLTIAARGRLVPGQSAKSENPSDPPLGCPRMPGAWDGSRGSTPECQNASVPRGSSLRSPPSSRLGDRHHGLHGSHSSKWTPGLGAAPEVRGRRGGRGVRGSDERDRPRTRPRGRGLERLPRIEYARALATQRLIQPSGADRPCRTTTTVTSSAG